MSIIVIYIKNKKGNNLWINVADGFRNAREYKVMIPRNKYFSGRWLSKTNLKEIFYFSHLIVGAF